MPRASGLTPKQNRFVVEYQKDGNATQAAIRAGYSQKTAYSIGHENLNKPEIAAFLGAKTAKSLGKLDLTVERVQREIARLAFFNPKSLYDDSGNLKPIHELDDDTAAAIAGIDLSQMVVKSADGTTTIATQTKKIKHHSKGLALALAAKHLKMLDKSELAGGVTLEELVGASMADEEK